jgi:hypothetical protein
MKFPRSIDKEKLFDSDTYLLLENQFFVERLLFNRGATDRTKYNNEIAHMLKFCKPSVKRQRTTHDNPRILIK